MKLSVKTTVVVEDGDVGFEIEYEDNVISIILDGKKLCSGDWDGNLKQVFKKAIELFEEDD